MKNIVILLLMFFCTTGISAQLFSPVTFETDNQITISATQNTTFSIVDNIENKKLNKSSKVLKIESGVSQKTQSIEFTLNTSVKTTASNRYLHVMVYTPSYELSASIYPANKTYGTEKYNVAFQNQWVEMVYELALNTSINKITFTPGNGEMFYVDNIYIDGNSVPSSASIKDSEAMDADIIRMPVNNTIITRTGGMNMEYILDGISELHFTYETTPLVKSTVHINSEDSWLFFDNMKPSVAIGSLSKVYVNGVKASSGNNVRLEIYGQGTVVIPHKNTYQPLTVYNEPELQGESKQYEQEIYHSNLGNFDKKIASFVLKRGYMATFSQNANGIGGASRVYIAADKDLIVYQLPIELDGYISRLRVFPWRYTSKKGYCGGNEPYDAEFIGASWYYTWGADALTTNNQDFVPMRHNRNWPGYGDINQRIRVNHVLGFNEPDQSDQANMNIEDMVRDWPNILVSGLRVGSPAYANFYGGTETFIKECEHRNLRVDFTAVHAYHGGQEKAWWVSLINNQYNATQRPLWITEWNNGANWTTEGGPKTDAEQEKDVKYIQDAFEEAGFLERYSIYNWVETWREVIRNGQLTPAGVVYKNRKSTLAYNPDFEYVQNPVVEKGQRFLIMNKRDGFLYQEGNQLRTSGKFEAGNLPETYYWTFEYSKQEIGGYKLINCSSGQVVTYKQSKLLNGFIMSDDSNNTYQNLSIAAYSTEDKGKNQTKTYYTISYYNGLFQYNYQAMDGYGSNTVGSYDITRSNNQQWAILPQIELKPKGNVHYQILANQTDKYLSVDNELISFETNRKNKNSYWKIILLENGKYQIIDPLNNRALTSNDNGFFWSEINLSTEEQQFNILHAYRENGISRFSISDNKGRRLQAKADNSLGKSQLPIIANDQVFRFREVTDEFNSIPNILLNSVKASCNPNPVSDFTVFHYTLDSPANITLRVYSATGILVSEDKDQGISGENYFVWYRKNIPSGMYLYEIIPSNLPGTKFRGKIIVTD